MAALSCAILSESSCMHKNCEEEAKASRCPNAKEIVFGFHLPAGLSCYVQIYVQERQSTCVF